jgi:TetR/AcrR family transcriptional repressor of mexJK operon
VQTLASIPAPDPKEEQILAAAREAFFEFGYAGTSMDLVAQRARASKTTLYARFPSKEALFAAVIHAECERQGMRFDTDALAALPVDEALTRIGRAFVRLIWSPAAVCMERIISGEAARFPEVAAIFYREGPERVTQAVGAYFAAAAANGLVVCDDPAFAAGQFLMAMKGSTHCELVMGVGEPPSDVDAFVARTVRLLLDGLRPRG